MKKLIAMNAGESYTVDIIKALEKAGWTLKEVAPGINNFHVYLEFTKTEKK